MAENTTPAVVPAPVPDAKATPSPQPVPVKQETPIVQVDENGVAVATPRKMWKLNVNGKEVEYDASDESKLQRDVQKVFGIEEKAKTAAEKASQADALIQMLQSDPKGFDKRCKALGIDAKRLATDILYEEIRRNSMTPEQRELEEYKEREREAAEVKKQQDESTKVAEAQRKTQEWAQKFEKDCEEALKAGSIPKTRLALALVAQYIDAGLKQQKDYTVAQVLPYVHRDLQAIHQETLGKLEGDDLLAYVGEELSNKIAKARVEKYKKSQALKDAEKRPVQASSPVSKNPDLSKLKGKAYWKALRQIKSEEGIGFLPGLSQ